MNACGFLSSKWVGKIRETKEVMQEREDELEKNDEIEDVTKKIYVFMDLFLVVPSQLHYVYVQPM